MRPRENVGGLEIGEHDLDRAAAGLVGDLAALSVRRRYGGAAGQRHSQRLRQRVHGGRGPHGVAMADRGRRGGDEVDVFLVVDLAGCELLAHRPFDRARARALALPPAVEHRSAGQHDRGDVHGRGRHERGRRGLVAARCEHDAVERIAEQHLDQAEIGEVAIERGGRPLAGLLDRMRRKLERNAARIADAVAHALCQLQVMTVAGRKVGARLGDADDRPPRHDLLPGETEIEIALEVERGHPGVFRIVEPELRAQAASARMRFVDRLGHEAVAPECRAPRCQG